MYHWGMWFVWISRCMRSNNQAVLWRKSPPWSIKHWSHCTLMLRNIIPRTSSTCHTLSPGKSNTCKPTFISSQLRERYSSVKTYNITVMNKTQPRNKLWLLGQVLFDFIDYILKYEDKFSDWWKCIKFAMTDPWTESKIDGMTYFLNISCLTLFDIYRISKHIFQVTIDPKIHI